MSKRLVPLGAASCEAQAVVATEATMEERIYALEKRINELTSMFNQINMLKMKEKRVAQDLNLDKTGLNKDGIPINISLVGHSTKFGTRFLLVLEDGYVFAGQKYDSLSAAAEAASGVRRSGWTYWKTANELTVKEEYGRP